jgi:glycosyltransferase involved in cell wall biosynthesis
MLKPHGLRRLYRRITLVAVSAAARDELSALTGVPGTDIALVPSVSDPADVTDHAGTAPTGGLVVGAMGTATRRKGVDLWLDVVARVAEQRPGVAFQWVGDALPRWLERTVDGMSLGDRLRFLPAVDNPYPLLRGFSVFTLPSREETAGLAVQEAMALGLPVVSFALPAVAEQLGEAGCLVPPADTASMAAEIVRLLDNESARLELGDHARARAFARFSGEQYAAEVRSIVLGVLSTTGPDSKGGRSAGNSTDTVR